MALEAILFDAGNTLIELDYAFLTETLADLGVETTRQEVRRAEQRARVALDERLRNGHSTESRLTSLTYARLALAELGVEDSGILMKLIAEVARYRKERDIWNVPVEGAADLLRSLSESGFRLAVISNSNGTVEAGLRDRKLTEHLEFVLDSHHVGVEKPDPEIFRIALRSLRIAPEQALYVGDLYSVDVVGAREAGLRAVLLDPASAWETWEDLDCPTIPSIAYLPETIQRWK